MSSESVPLRKLLKSETSRQMLVSLNDRGALSLDVLMDILNMTPGLMDYHLKVLDECLVKTADDKYALSEKGKQAYALLSDLHKSGGVSQVENCISHTYYSSLIFYSR
jgi:predicted transcriptional regulator